MKPLSNSEMRDVETLLHPTTNLHTHRTNGPLVLDRAEGVHVYDTQGKRYIEGLAGLWCTGLGYGNKELVEAATEQMQKLSFTHLFGGRSHEPAIALAEKIKEISPAPTSKVFFTPRLSWRGITTTLGASRAKRRSSAGCAGIMASPSPRPA
jgi:4-aminobutyrate---pyruvate transaminase